MTNYEISRFYLKLLRELFNWAVRFQLAIRYIREIFSPFTLPLPNLLAIGWQEIGITLILHLYPHHCSFIVEFRCYRATPLHACICMGMWQSVSSPTRNLSETRDKGRKPTTRKNLQATSKPEISNYFSLPFKTP